jgi:hypothetical protein
MVDPLRTKFIVAPIATDLQRVARPDALAFVLVEMADDDFIDFKQLRQALADWLGRQRGSVFFNVRHGLGAGQTWELVDGQPSPQPVLFNQTELVRLAFDSIARDAGFRHATVNAYLPCKDRAWNLVVADFVANAQRDATADESPVGDELVEVYPVRTTMSRFENLSADYAVRIVPAVHELKSAAAKKIPAAIEAHLSKFRPGRRDKVAFMVTATKVGPKTIQGLGLLIGNAFWSKQLGYKLAGFRHLQAGK